MNLVSRVGQAVLWSQGGRVVEALLFFVFSLVLARTLGPQSFGIYALGISVASLCVFATLLGIGPETLGKFLPEITANPRSAQATGLLRKLLALRLGAIAMGVLILFGFQEAIAREFHLPWFVEAVGLIVVVFATRSIYDLLTYFNSALLELRLVALAKSLVYPFALAIFYVGILRDWGTAQFALLALAGGYLLGVIILGAGFVAPAAARTAEAPPQAVPLRRILLFGLFAWLISFFLFVLSDGADVLLVGWLVKDPTAVGYYAVGSSLVFRAMGLLLGWVPLVSIPAFSSAYLEGGVAGLAAAAQAQWKFMAFSLTAPLLLLFRFSHELVTLFYSANYSPSGPVMQILCALMACSMLFGLSLQAGVLYVLNRERLACSIVAAAAIFNLVVGILLIKKFGINGAAWATGLSFVFLSILCAAASSFFVPMRFPWRFILKMVSAGLIAVVSTLWLNPGSLVTLGAACAVWGSVFLVCLAVAKPLNSADAASLRLISPRLGYLAERFLQGAS